MRLVHKKKIILNNIPMNFSLWVNIYMHKHYSFLCPVAEEEVMSPISSEHKK